ncbi:MAG: class I SAM-dependent methyltransferase [Lachnospiraceae bacterium]
MTPLEEHYNKFNEDKRLTSRHGFVEYHITMKYVQESLAQIMTAEKYSEKKECKIFDIGAGTGAYCIPLSEEGYDVSAIELVNHNLGRLKQKGPFVKAKKGNALNLKKYSAEEFDLVLVFGPMYHLFRPEEKIQVLQQVKRVVKKNGIVMVAYLLNEYGLISYALKENHFGELIQKGRINENFECISAEEDLYDYIRLERIDEINREAGMERLKIITPDGPTNYIRSSLKSMTEEEYKFYLRYVENIAERSDMIGAAAHVVDILRKKE